MDIRRSVMGDISALTVEAEESLLIQNVLCASTLRDVCLSLSRAPREAQ